MTPALVQGTYKLRARVSDQAGNEGTSNVSTMVVQSCDPLVVTTATDVVDDTDGVTSLREAVAYANSHAGTDAITFSSSLAGKTITLTSGELGLTDTAGKTTITGLGATQLTVSGNNASRVFDINSGVTAEISGLTSTHGVSDGGGIYNSGTLTITDCIISGNGNADAWEGGGIFNEGTLTIIGCTISGNSAVNWGGGIYNWRGSVTIADSTISDNSAKFHGGIENLIGPMTITDSTISGNSAATRGGGIGNWSGVLTITGCTIVGNSAGWDGGGIENYHYENYYGTLTINNSTISGNSAENCGGGIWQDGVSTMTVAGCTICGNLAGWQGGGIFDDDFYSSVVTTTLNNTIVANNSSKTTSPDISNNSNYGTVTANYCLIEDTTGATFSSSSANNITGVDPKLGTLGDYGGSTQTIPLLAGSPVIDAGSNALIPTGVTTDQRGYARIVNATVDIGAYEAVDTTVLTVSQASLTPSGFTVQFNREIDPSVLNLYDVQGNVFGPSDVTLVGSTVGAVKGSVLVQGNTLTFIKTGGPLAADSYTVTLRSANDGIRDQQTGQPLDGEWPGAEPGFPSGDGTPGGNFVYSFTIGSQVLDQVVDFTNANSESYINSTTQHAQTFTVGQGGLLNRVDLRIKRSSSAIVGDLRLEIRTTTADGLPLEGSAGLLGSLTLPASQFQVGGDFGSAPFVTFDLTSQHIVVQQGDVLAICLSSPQTVVGGIEGYLWIADNAGSDPGTYANGTGFFQTTEGDWANQGWVPILGNDKAIKTYLNTESNPIVVSLPDFARGPGQAVDVPAGSQWPADSGWPADSSLQCRRRRVGRVGDPV